MLLPSSFLPLADITLETMSCCRRGLRAPPHQATLVHMCPTTRCYGIYRMVGGDGIRCLDPEFRRPSSLPFSPAGPHEKSKHCQRGLEQKNFPPIELKKARAQRERRVGPPKTKTCTDRESTGASLRIEPALRTACAEATAGNVTPISHRWVEG